VDFQVIGFSGNLPIISFSSFFPFGVMLWILTFKYLASFTSAVLRLQRFDNKLFQDITEEQLRQYWLCCQNEFGWSAARYWQYHIEL